MKVATAESEADQPDAHGNHAAEPSVIPTAAETPGMLPTETTLMSDRAAPIGPGTRLADAIRILWGQVLRQFRTGSCSLGGGLV